MKRRILVLNPGAGSTKVALFADEEKEKFREIRHSPDEFEGLSTLEELPLRLKEIYKFLEDENIEELDAISSRGGALKPLKSGTYIIDEKVVEDIRNGEVQTDHPSNLGPLMAYELAKKFNVNAYFVDPVSVDEMVDEARLSGIPELERKSLAHSLNMRYVAKKTAEILGLPLEEINLIVLHLGTGISIAPFRKGQMIDVNNANDGGPFSPQRAGTLPTTGLVRLCFSGKWSEDQLIRYLTRRAGLLSYLGTDDLEEIERRIEEGDEKAKLVYRAMVYQIVKETGSMYAILKGELDGIVITGGMARSNRLTGDLKEWLDFMGPIFVFPGEMEMEALAFGVLKVLKGEEEAKRYPY